MRTPTAFAHMALAALLGAACLFTLSEQDLFWQVRAGDELWRTGRFPTQDSWSLTVSGAPWRNFEWLSTLLLRGAFAVGGVAGMVVCRGLCVAALCAQWSLIARRAGASLAQSVALTALLWAATLPRLQLRPELFALLCQSGLGALWLSARSPEAKGRGTVLITLVAANLHPGVTPLIGVGAAAWLFPHRAWAHMAACLLAPLCTPNGLHVIPFLWEHAAYFAQGALPNPEHQPMSWGYLTSASGVAAAALLAAAAAGSIAKRAAWALVAACSLLVLVAIARTRAMPFACVAALPWAAAWTPPGRGRHAGLAAATWALCLWAAAPLASAWGLGLAPELSPEGATAYLQARRPTARLLHNYIDGAYLVWFRREALDFVDTRETLFWRLETQLRDAFTAPEAMHSLTQAYAIDSVLLPIPNEDAGALRMLFSAERWPLVYFDATHLLLASRDTAPSDAYRWLDPTAPANAYAHSAARTPSNDTQVLEELARCLSADPRNAWCWLARGALLGAQGHGAMALQDLARAHALLPRASAQRSALAAELSLQHAGAGSAR